MHPRLTSCFPASSRFYVVGPSGEKVHVQGNLTNGEDIGDSGLRVAWKAWKEAVKDKGEEDKLPGLSEFSDEQLFFLAFGRCVSVLFILRLDFD